MKNETEPSPEREAPDREAPAEVIGLRSDRFSRFINGYFTRLLGKSFHAIRLLDGPAPVEGPLIACMNHPSWNDPMVISFLHYRFFSDREAYGPIDADALQGYPFMRRIGLYPITHGNAGSARQFLRTSRAILDRPGTAIWITPQGKFSDQRERPVRFEPGLGFLLRSLDRSVTVLPVAVEYTFGEERFAEIFVSFGKPVERPRENDAQVWSEAAARALEATQDRLAERVIRKDLAEFEDLLGGAVGVGGVYEWWQRFRAFLGGKRYDPRHGSLTS